MRSVSLFVISGDLSCAFDWKSFFCFFIYFTFSVSLNVREIVIYCSLEGVCLCGNIPVQIVCIQYFWYESFIGVGASHILSQPP